MSFDLRLADFIGDFIMDAFHNEVDEIEFDDWDIETIIASYHGTRPSRELILKTKVSTGNSEYVVKYKKEKIAEYVVLSAALLHYNSLRNLAS